MVFDGESCPMHRIMSTLDIGELNFSLESFHLLVVSKL